MNIILPPGSTSAELQAAIDNADSGDTIIVSSDMQFTGISAVTIPGGKEITIQSDTGNNWILSQTVSDTRHFMVSGSLVLQNIILDGNADSGGIHANSNGRLTLNSGSVIQYCHTTSHYNRGGGVYVNYNAAVTISGGTIRNNTADYGAGIFVSNNSTCIMNSGTVSNNSADTLGGGISVYGINASMVMNDGEINDNWAGSDGGGVYVYGRFTMEGGVINANTSALGSGIYMVSGNVTMNDGTISSNTATRNGGGVNLHSSSAFTMNGGTINNNQCSNGGGVYVGANCNFTLNSGIIESNTGTRGGGILVNGTGVLDMNSGTVTGNTVTSYGGGVNVSDNGLFNMYDGIIGGNTAYEGGGVYITNSSFNMHHGTISSNTVNRYGGGVMVNNGKFIINDATINDNTANNSHGGGIYLTVAATLEITDSSSITNNSAPNGHGGGIYTADTSYSNLTTSGDTVFNGNRSIGVYIPPKDASVLYPNIQFARTSIMDHPLNNYDINYQRGELLTYHVTYDANGGTGSYMGPNIVPGGTDTVLTPSETGISRENYAFTGWNTEPDGSGTDYNPGDIINLDCNMTLYAQWVAAIFNITYGANGGSGGFEDTAREYGTYYTILSVIQAGVSRPGFTFIGWNTKPDGSGISFTPGDIVTITGDVRLYAQWRQNPTPRPVKICRKTGMKGRKNIEGQKIWDDDGNMHDTRPDNVEILLLRDGEVYKRTLVNSKNGWAFGFCCLPVMNNSGRKYDYQIDETAVPDYTKKIEGYNITNTLNP